MDKELKNVLKEIKKLKKSNKKTEKNSQKFDNGPVTLDPPVGIGIGIGPGEDIDIFNASGGFISDFKKGLADGVNDNVEYSENKKEEKDIDDLSR